MYTGRMIAGLPALLAAGLLVAACSEPVGLKRSSVPSARSFATVGTASGITLDQVNGTGGEKSDSMLIKGFNPTNPHNGDAIVATFFWLGSTNIIDSVTDVLTTTPYTPVGNKYNLVEYVTTGGVSMATYVATNVQNFPDAYSDPSGTYILGVRASISVPVTDGGVMLSAWSGVNAVTPAVGAHQSASGAGTSPTIADPGKIPIGTGALAYGVTMSNGFVPLYAPAGFTYVDNTSDNVFKADGEYAVSATVGSIDPQWTWYFSSTNPGSWLATVVALNPPLHFVFTVQPSTTLPLMTITPAVTVAAVDALGNTVTSFNGSVTIAIGHNGGLLMPGTLSGTTTVTAANGVATFSNLSIDQAGNGYTLAVTASGLTGAQSAAFNIGAF